MCRYTLYLAFPLISFCLPLLLFLIRVDPIKPAAQEKQGRRDQEGPTQPKNFFLGGGLLNSNQVWLEKEEEEKGVPLSHHHHHLQRKGREKRIWYHLEGEKRWEGPTRHETQQLMNLNLARPPYC